MAYDPGPDLKRVKRLTDLVQGRIREGHAYADERQVIIDRLKEHGVTVTEIAAASGMSRPAIYKSASCR